MPFFVANVDGLLALIPCGTDAWAVEKRILTRDQVRSLRSDNVVTRVPRTLADLGIYAHDYGAVMPEYLWRFRPSGQYAAIKESAKNLRKA